MFSTFGLHRSCIGGESVVVDVALESGNVDRFQRCGPIYIMERRERLVVETVEVVEIDTSEARDDADASESNESLQIHPCSSSSCILIVTMIANGT
jgi:hypothetical protein